MSLQTRSISAHASDTQTSLPPSPWLRVHQERFAQLLLSTEMTQDAWRVVGILVACIGSSLDRKSLGGRLPFAPIRFDAALRVAIANGIVEEVAPQAYALSGRYVYQAGTRVRHERRRFRRQMRARLEALDAAAD